MSASNPAPAITANRSPFMLATSTARLAPKSPVATAPSMSFGMPRLEASRFAVPAGTIAIVRPVPASVSMQRCAIPSPPHTKKCSAPCSSSRRTCLGALRLFGTSTQSGSVTPFWASTRRSSGSPPSTVLPPWAMTAILLTPPSPGAPPHRRHGRR